MLVSTRAFHARYQETTNRWHIEQHSQYESSKNISEHYHRRGTTLPHRSAHLSNPDEPATSTAQIQTTGDGLNGCTKAVRLGCANTCKHTGIHSQIQTIIREWFQSYLTKRITHTPPEELPYMISSTSPE